MRAGEPELIAEELDEQKMRFDGGGHGFPVDRQADAERHFHCLLCDQSRRFCASL
jgi:hypothetical protein